MINTEQEPSDLNLKERGCRYRYWGWHDGGPDYGCCKSSKIGFCCTDSYSDYFSYKGCYRVNKDEQ